MDDVVTEDDLRNWVRSYVWRGEDDADEIELLVGDQLGDDDGVDEDWLRKVIRAEVAAKRKAEKTWPKVTDCDRLDRAFLGLRSIKIIALSNAGYTQSDGLEEVEEAYQEAGGSKSAYAGHCFFTEQDQQRALDGGGLYVGFGHLSGDDSKGAEVGRLLRTALETEGFRVEWDGSVSTRLFLVGFHWQRRSPR
jgi:hypothetical protein